MTEKSSNEAKLIVGAISISAIALLWLVKPSLALFTVACSFCVIIGLLMTYKKYEAMPKHIVILFMTSLMLNPLIVIPILIYNKVKGK